MTYKDTYKNSRDLERDLKEELTTIGINIPPKTRYPLQCDALRNRGGKYPEADFFLTMNDLDPRLVLIEIEQGGGQPIRNILKVVRFLQLGGEFCWKEKRYRKVIYCHFIWARKDRQAIRIAPLPPPQDSEGFIIEYGKHRSRYEAELVGLSLGLLFKEARSRSIDLQYHPFLMNYPDYFGKLKREEIRSLANDIAKTLQSIVTK